MRFRMTYDEYNGLRCGDTVRACDGVTWVVTHTRPFMSPGGLNVLHRFKVKR